MILSPSVLFISFIFFLFNSPDFSTPIQLSNRKDFSNIRLTDIGDFGIERKARPNIPAHLHTGIDIKRPNNNYDDNPIFPIANGIVISKRTDGPYAQLIIEHKQNRMIFCTVYEHIAEIRVDLNEKVTSDMPIARFFSQQELDKYGWQFDHFHFEILRKYPLKISPTLELPERHFKSYTLTCYTEDKLLSHFYDPISFLDLH